MILQKDIWTDLCGEDQIRLLHISQSATADNLLDCRLETVPLDHLPPTFVAISYTWGDEQQRAHLICNGIQCSVTQSCVDALKAVQSRGKTQVWIDQLCVRQGDKDDVREQVQLMRQIYSSAARVYVWLGNLELDGRLGSISHNLEADSAHLVRQSLVILLMEADTPADQPTASHNMLHSTTRQLERLRLPLKPAEKRFVESCRKYYTILLNLLNRRYLNRRWVIQEIALNREVDVFLEDLCFPFSNLVSCALLLRSMFSLIDYGPLRSHFSELLGEDLTWRFQNEMVPYINMNNVDLINRMRHSLQNGVELDLVEISLQCSRFNNSQEVDDLYAIRALFQGNSQAAASIPRIDYDAAVEDIYYDHTAWMFSHCGVKILSRLPLQFCNNRGLPTWSVDYSSAFDMTVDNGPPSDRLSYRNEIWFDYLSQSRTPGLNTTNSTLGESEGDFERNLPQGAATFSLPQARPPLVANRKLHISAYVLDVVSDLMDRDTYSSLAAIAQSHEWYRSQILQRQTTETRTRMSSQIPAIKRLRYDSLNENITVFREKILYNLTCLSRPPTVDTEKDLIYVPERGRNPLHKGFLTEYRSKCGEEAMSLLGKLVFGITQDGWPVLLPYEAEIGDQIAFFAGVTKPFVLRKSAVPD